MGWMAEFVGYRCIGGVKMHCNWLSLEAGSWRLEASSVQFYSSLYSWEQVTPGAGNKSRIGDT